MRRTWRVALPSRSYVAGFCVCLAMVSMAGCGGSGEMIQFFAPLFTSTVGTAATGGPTTTGRETGSTVGTGTGAFTDPCTEPQNRKLVRISMRNEADTYVHYFLVMIAFVNGPEYPTGGVCPDDVAFYTASGYVQVPAGSQVELGTYCITGPALYYFHRNGQFRTAGGGAAGRLASAIGPAQGTTPTYDNFFTSAGALVPVPDQILFYNPGTTPEGQALKLSVNRQTPCTPGDTGIGAPDCQQDAFYYVTEDDRRDGSAAVGVGSARRLASDVQGTGCECLGVSQAYQALAPSGTAALSAQCNQFFRGGRIEYVFVREDTDPPYPQLLWRVTDAAGARAQDFDPRSGVK